MLTPYMIMPSRAACSLAERVSLRSDTECSYQLRRATRAQLACRMKQMRNSKKSQDILPPYLHRAACDSALDSKASSCSNMRSCYIMTC